MHFSRLITLGAVSALALSACADATDDPQQPGDSPTTVTVVTHDSFAIPDQVIADFEAEHAITVNVIAPGDAGSLVNQLILTQGAPLGDVVYGIDNTFASRGISEGVFASYTSSAPAAADAAQYAIEGSDVLTAIDFSDVCINVDLAYFEARDLPVPTTIADLADPHYRGLLSVPNPATSSPGLAFLVATIASEGDDWPLLWEALRDNDLRVTAGWSETYYSDFSGPSSGGDYPLVVSYASSPPYEVGDDGVATTAALLETCFRQVEYAGVLAGAENPEGAQLVIDWMLSDDFQRAVPESMYVYPVSTAVEVPADWAQHAPLSPAPWSLPADQIAAERDVWIDQWTSVVID